MSDLGTPLSGLLGLIFTCAIIIAIPGPSIMFFIGQVMSAGRKQALYGVIGNAIGMFCIAMLLSLGLGALILKSNLVLSVIRLFGALALLYIGLHYLKPARSHPTLTQQSQPTQNHPLTAGIIVGVTNPKAFIMFGSIVPSFLSTDITNPTAMLMLYALVPILLGLIIDATWVMFAHMISSRTITNARHVILINRIGGSLIIIMAMVLATEVISAWLNSP